MPQAVIFCESYGQITYTLQLINKNYSERSVTVVIPGFQDLFKFFQIINEKVFKQAITVIYVEPYVPVRAKVRGIAKLFHLLPDIIKERRGLKDIFTRTFSEFTDAEVFFFSQGFSGLKIFLLQKLSKRNRLIFFNLFPGPSGMRQYVPMNITSLVNLLIWKLIYGKDITIGRLPYYKGFIFTSDRFMKKEVYRYIDSSEIDEMMKDFDFSIYKVFDTGDYEAIYFDEDLVENGYVLNSSIFRQEIAKAFDLLVKYFPKEKIAYKYHPGYTGDANIIKVGNMLPSFIPAELLYNEKTRLYLGLCTKSLASVEKGLAVSIMDMVTFKSAGIKNLLKEQLVQMSKSKILFPKSHDEFERILIDLKGHG
jgi:hypothetical protein